MLVAVILIIAGLALLVKGSDWFVNAAARLAKSLGVSEFVIGLTLVAFGTSFPEFVTSLTSAIRGETDIIIGNQVGSVIANIALIIGLGASISQIKTKWEMVSRDGYMMLAGGFIFLLVTINGIISTWEAALLLSFYYAYILFLALSKGKYEGKYHFKEFLTFYFTLKPIQHLTEVIGRGTGFALEGAMNGPKVFTEAAKEARKKLKMSVIKDLAMLVLTGAIVAIGANFLVVGAVEVAQEWGITTTVIGLTIVAVGTSLPELSVVVSAARKGFGDIAIGNIIGANIANIFLNIGVAGVITTITVPMVSRFYTIPFMIFLMLVFIVFMKTGWTISRLEGALLLFLYGVFMAILLLGF